MTERLAVAATAPLWLVSAAGAVSWWAVHWLTGGLRRPGTRRSRPVTGAPAPAAGRHFVTAQRARA